MEGTAAIGLNELLFRAVKRSKPETLVDGRVTSALFKEAVYRGVSVDREAGRKRSDVIVFILNGSLRGRVKGIACFHSNVCEEIGAVVEITPSSDNPYHADIILDKDNEQNYNLQTWQLAKACKVVYEDKMMGWT